MSITSDGASSDMPAPGSGAPLWRRFIFSVSLVVALFVLGIFLGVFVRNREVVRDEVLNRARSQFHGIVLMREWNARYGGVFVEKTPGVESNPFLEHPDIVAREGTVYTKKNPALMTREMSELADKQGMFRFHITSLNPLNPGNRPDAFERGALESFEKGAHEATVTEHEGGKTYFRYMAPLYVGDPCLSCHAKQGYKPGDVRGGISVRFDVTGAEHSQAVTGTVIVVLCVVTIGLLLGIIYYFIYNLMTRLRQTESRLAAMAMTDPLTGLGNRRAFFARLEQEYAGARRHKSALGCVLMDIDHFKAINDTHGHQVGDRVLAGVAEVLRETLRVSDTPARFGGEEFIVLLPSTGLDGACQTAEKLRIALAGREFEAEEGRFFRVTASFGCTAMEPDGSEADGGAERLVRMADESLYVAKAEGRNTVRSRVCVLNQ